MQKPLICEIILVYRFAVQRLRLRAEYEGICERVFIEIGIQQIQSQFQRSTKMGKIDFTNIVIDDFSYAKKDPYNRYVHILTHIHSDHLKGLSDSWNYGIIYTTKITAKLLKARFPDLKCLHVLEEDKQHIIRVAPTLEVTVTLLNANHCLGAVMVLIEGYMGTILYTGDMRFDRAVFQQHTYLYPAEKKKANFQGVSKAVDILYVDNTFLNQKFKFPPQKEALQLVDDFVNWVKSNRLGSRIFIGLDNYGKEQVLVHLAKHVDTYILVDDLRYDSIRQMGLDTELFTTNPDDGWIRVVSKKMLRRYLDQDPQSLGLILSGWTNQPHYRSQGRIYCVPYSLHSNYRQIHQFVASIRPAMLHPIVPDARKQENTRQLLIDEMYSELHFADQLDRLRRMYASPLSEEYRQLLEDISIQKKIMARLEMERPSEITTRVESGMSLIGLQTNPRKKYKLKASRDEQEIERVKSRLKYRRKMMQIDNVEILDSDEIDQQDILLAIEQNQKANKKDYTKDDFIEEQQQVVVDPFALTFKAKAKNSSIDRKEDRRDMFGNYQSKNINPKQRPSLSNNAVSGRPESQAVSKLADNEIMSKIRQKLKEKSMERKQRQSKYVQPTKDKTCKEGNGIEIHQNSNNIVEIIDDDESPKEAFGLNVSGKQNAVQQAPSISLNYLDLDNLSSIKFQALDSQSIWSNNFASKQKMADLLQLIRLKK